MLGEDTANISDKSNIDTLTNHLVLGKFYNNSMFGVNYKRPGLMIFIRLSLKHSPLSLLLNRNAARATFPST